jgi:hypothetical protein
MRGNILVNDSKIIVKTKRKTDENYNEKSVGGVTRLLNRSTVYVTSVVKVNNPQLHHAVTTAVAKYHQTRNGAGIKRKTFISSSMSRVIKAV